MKHYLTIDDDKKNILQAHGKLLPSFSFKVHDVIFVFFNIGDAHIVDIFTFFLLFSLFFLSHERRSDLFICLRFFQI